MDNQIQHDESSGRESSAPTPPQIVIQQPPTPKWRTWLTRILLAILVVSLFLNLALFATYQEYFAAEAGPMERYRSGDEFADDKIALIEVTGTIMPPFTERILRCIKRAKTDEQVKGVLLSIDSPGGLVADSHQIYHALTELRETKPIYVSMKRMAASGGYYVAMGAGVDGKIFAETTTWTGSIGVIIPRYDIRKLAEKFGVDSVPLKTGEFKDALSPFRELSPAERQVWDHILDDAFQRFLHVIADNRSNLDYNAVKELATGQIYTASDAQAVYGLVDEIGYEDDAVEALARKLGLDQYRVVKYRFQPNLMELLAGTVKSRQPDAVLQKWLDTSVPKAMYYCSWADLSP